MAPRVRTAGIPADPASYDSAVGALLERVPVTREEFDELSDAAQARAFTISAVAQADLVSQVLDALAAAVRDGTSFEEFKDEVGDKLERAWGGEIPGRLETIFRTNVQTAYSHGRYRIMREGAVARARPYARLDGVADQRQSDICEELDGTVLPAEEFARRRLVPPLHFNCRTGLTPLSAAEAREEGIGGRVRAKADEGFGAAPDEDEYEPDLNGYPPEVSEILARRLRGR